MNDYITNNLMNWTRLGMRKAFGLMMCDIAQTHSNIITIAADVASSANLTEYAEMLPSQYLNIGISEQNMTGVATGLAKEGYNVFIVSFAPFAAMRAFEAIRTLVGYMHLNIKVIALSSGVSLGVQGNTHYCIEDIAIMRTIPGMTVLSPADCTEEAKCLQILADYDGPAYLRLTGIDGSPSIYKEDYEFKLGKNITIRHGEDVAIFATGSLVNESIRAARALQREKISCTVIDMHTIKPTEVENIRNISLAHKLIVTIEEHNIIGGLGASIAEQLAQMDEHPPLMMIGIEDVFPHSGDYAYVLKQCGLTASQIVDRIIKKYRCLSSK